MLMRAWRCKPLHLEVIEAKFLFELLMGLLAEPPCLDGRGECSEGARRWEVRQLILLLAGRPTLADEPDLFVTWEVLVRAFSGAGSVPSATRRTRIAANDALSGPLVPRRHVTVRHFCSSSASCAASGLTSGTSLWRGRPRGATGQVSTTSGE